MLWIPSPGLIPRILAVFVTAMLAAQPASAAEQWNHPLGKTSIPGLQHGVFRSESMGVEVGYNIYLPPAYAANATARFPVIYYLHGFDGDESSYPDYARLMDRAIRDGTIPPTILVLVNGGKTSFFSDSPDGTVKAETCLIRELLPHIDLRYRTIATREGRSLHGYSMGGFGALKLGFKFPELFSSMVAYAAVVPTAAELRKESPRIFKSAFGDKDSAFTENDPTQLARLNADKIRGKLAIQIVLGGKDETVEMNRRLHQLLVGLNIPHDYLELPGVPHSKDPLYAKAALGAFQFSEKSFHAGSR